MTSLLALPDMPLSLATLLAIQTLTNRWQHLRMDKQTEMLDPAHISSLRTSTGERMSNALADQP